NAGFRIGASLLGQLAHFLEVHAYARMFAAQLVHEVVTADDANPEDDGAAVKEKAAHSYKNDRQGKTNNARIVTANGDCAHGTSGASCRHRSAPRRWLTCLPGSAASR